MRKTLREEILSVNVKKDSTLDEIINTVDDFCRKNTNIRFALGFYYLFIAAVEKGALLYDDGLGVAVNIFNILYPKRTAKIAYSSK